MFAYYDRLSCGVTGYVLGHLFPFPLQYKWPRTLRDYILLSVLVLLEWELKLKEEKIARIHQTLF